MIVMNRMKDVFMLWSRGWKKQDLQMKLVVFFFESIWLIMI